MKKLLLLALTGALLVPALPGAAQSPSPTPTPTATTEPGLPLPGATASPTPTATATATPASTQAPGAPTLTYAGRGLTRSLGISLAGNPLAFGVTTARTANAATSECAGVACATGAAAVEPIGETATATSPGNPGPSSVEAFNLGADTDPQLEQLLTASIGSAMAQTTDQPSSAATANGSTIDVTLTQTVINELPPEITDGLADGLGQIGEALSPIAEGDPTGIVGGVTDTLAGLVGDLGSGPLMRIQIGESASSSEFADASVSARAQAAGAIITVLPTPDSSPLLPEGLAIIEVTPSTATASADGTNRATAEAEASIARITLLPGILDGIPDLDPGAIEGLPLGDIIDMLPPEVVGLLPAPILEALGGGGSADPTPAPTSTSSEGGPTGTPIDDILPGFMQADEDSGGFVIDLQTGADQVCILEGTPLETCVLVGGTSENFTEDGLGVGVLAAGVDVSALRADGVGQLEIAVGRSEAGVAAAFVQAPPPPTTPPTTPTALPQTGTNATVVLPALLLMGLSGIAFVGLRRGRETA